ncbi:hypothetical protein MC885_001336, partial [Smutsia gigantea]
PADLNVVLGTNSVHSPSLEVKGVTSIVLHKDFKQLNMDSDIALLLLGLTHHIQQPERTPLYAQASQPLQVAQMLGGRMGTDQHWSMFPTWFLQVFKMPAAAETSDGAGVLPRRP